MRFGFWMPVFGGWLRNVEDENMQASWEYVSKLTRRAEEIELDHLRSSAPCRGALDRPHYPPPVEPRKDPGREAPKRARFPGHGVADDRRQLAFPGPLEKGIRHNRGVPSQSHRQVGARAVETRRLHYQPHAVAAYALDGDASNLRRRHRPKDPPQELALRGATVDDRRNRARLHRRHGEGRRSRHDRRGNESDRTSKQDSPTLAPALMLFARRYRAVPTAR